MIASTGAFRKKKKKKQSQWNMLACFQQAPRTILQFLNQGMMADG